MVERTVTREPTQEKLPDGKLAVVTCHRGTGGQTGEKYWQLV